jgi:hypothetical protein
MHVYESRSNAHGHSDCCVAINVCMYVTVIAARRCMRVLVCWFVFRRRMVTVIAARRCMRVCMLLFMFVQGAWSL